MDSHKNARLTPKGREAMVRSVVDDGRTKAAAARQFNTSAKTVAKWVDRFRKDGIEGLRDQHSQQRTDDLPIWLHRHNWHRPHAGINDKTPVSRLGLTGNNVLRLHI